VRMSIHAHLNTNKFAVALLPGLRSLATPWHNVVLRRRDGTHALMHRDAAEALGDAVRLVERDGRPWCFEEV
jgi:pyoverdine/dityrosine biosynthesis protein Dit1